MFKEIGWKFLIFFDLVLNLPSSQFQVYIPINTFLIQKKVTWNKKMPWFHLDSVNFTLAIRMNW